MFCRGYWNGMLPQMKRFCKGFGCAGGRRTKISNKGQVG